MSQTAPTGKPGRYQRSFGGLVGSMIVLVLVVFGIIVFRGTFRDTPEYEPADIDYVEMVTSIQQLGLEPVYPPALPDGWTVKDASFESGDRPAIDLVFATDDDHTAGIHQADESESTLLGTYVGDGASETGETLTTDLATWTGWDDTDDDHAWTTELGDDTVLVYSSGDPDELTTFVESLTTAPLAP
ncbi:DUF4245 family protein [Nocardioides sp. YIM 152315]|uniref:DUF4245 family protein n=1 Tax=Nocardioides sp. YIM 152315 TaxID=3031760 RepID=UPI0023DCE476|nr:DUF4245 family protein [Nocardioides sp. YIM 152315]MDF1605378.1 DUF4245 family protein [Nocardioides sp. YIM 152315]